MGGPGGVHKVYADSVLVPVPSLCPLYKMPRKHQCQSSLASGLEIPESCLIKTVTLFGFDCPPPKLCQVVAQTALSCLLLEEPPARFRGVPKALRMPPAMLHELGRGL